MKIYQTIPNYSKEDTINESPIKIDNFVPKFNSQAHVDIERDILNQQNGLFTFILRIHNGKITDYSVVKYADARKYFRLTEVTVTELSVPRSH